MKTEFHHDTWGVLVLWAHTCGHHSNSLRYATVAQAEAERAAREGQPCWECRNDAVILAAKEKR